MRNLIPLAAMLAALAPAPARAQAEAPTDAVSRALTVRAASDDAVTDAVSRELTVWTPSPEVVSDASTREISLWVSASDEPADAMSREFTAYVPPYVMEDALAALRIAAGFLAATPADAAHLKAVATVPPDAITLADAARILRIVLKLEP